MRLSDAELQWMQTRLAQRYAAAGREAQETKLERKLAALPPDQALLTSWCYAASPLSDWANYDFSLFSACAAHALFMRKQSPEVRALPEQLFLNYVLHPRVNEEELCNCRGVSTRSWQKESKAFLHVRRFLLSMLECGAGLLPLDRRANHQCAGRAALRLRALRRGIHVRSQRAASSRDPGAAGVYAPLGALR